MKILVFCKSCKCTSIFLLTNFANSLPSLRTVFLHYANVHDSRREGLLIVQVAATNVKRVCILCKWPRRVSRRFAYCVNGHDERRGGFHIVQMATTNVGEVFTLCKWPRQPSRRFSYCANGLNSRRDGFRIVQMATTNVGKVFALCRWPRRTSWRLDELLNCCGCYWSRLQTFA